MLETHVEGDEDVDDRKRGDHDGEERRGAHHADDPVVSLLYPYVRRETERADDEDEVDRAEEERRERVVQDEVLEARPFRACGGLIARQLERILEVAGVFFAAEGRPRGRPSRSLRASLR